MKNLLFIGLLLIQNALLGQDINLKVEVSSDSVLVGNYIEVRFTIENGGGDFEAPQFEGFDVMSGPNTSSSFSMINGSKVSQEASYTYLIRPVKEGQLYIEPAYFISGEMVLETEPLGIMVYPNPAGIEENSTFKQKLDKMDMALPDLFRPRKAPEKKKKFEQKRRKI